MYNGDVSTQGEIEIERLEECIHIYASYAGRAFNLKPPVRYLSGAYCWYHPEPRVRRRRRHFYERRVSGMPRDIRGCACEPPGGRSDFLWDPVALVESCVCRYRINPSGTCLPHVARQFAVFRDVK